MSKEKDVILIVDDNPNNLMVLIDVLDIRNYEIRIAKDGQSALDILQHEKVNLILLDVIMPVMNGFEVCSRLKANRLTRNIPVIFMTALSETINKIRGFELGAVDYVTKPIQIEEVMARIKTHLKLQKLLENESEVNKFKSHFSLIASNELRTYLNLISASNSFLKLYGSRLSEDEKKPKFEAIDDSVKKIFNIIDNILTFSESDARKKSFSPERINIANFCKHIYEEFKALIPDSHNIVFSCKSSDIQAFIDPDLMRHILSALISNAFKYSPPGTLVYLDVFSKGEEIGIRVSDEGTGISETEREKIFKPFYRGKNAEKTGGAGLGLSIARQFLELHKGRITLESTEGKGSAFTIYLPG